MYILFPFKISILYDFFLFLYIFINNNKFVQPNCYIPGKIHVQHATTVSKQYIMGYVYGTFDIPLCLYFVYCGIDYLIC